MSTYKSFETGKPVVALMEILLTTAPPVRRVKRSGGWNSMISVTQPTKIWATLTAVQLLLGPKVGMLTLRMMHQSLYITKDIEYERHANTQRKKTLLRHIHPVGNSTDNVRDDLETSLAYSLSTSKCMVIP